VRAGTLSISVVVYQPDVPCLVETLESLVEAVRRAREAGLLTAAQLFLIDNGSSDPAGLDRAIGWLAEPRTGVDFSVLRGHGNVGYGRGHNLGLRQAHSEYHLILNPDVRLEPDALVEGLLFLNRQQSVGLVAPDVRGADGERQFLCREYPDLFTLLLRGFAPPAVRGWFAARLERYEMRDRLGNEVVDDVPIASGCFMLARTGVLNAVSGFAESYFLYFEDYDLSLRLRRLASIAYVPRVRIIHLGGGAARKGALHVRLFLESAWRFFRTHGWKVA
jgi:GT2 family glycosyltransferase